MVIERTFNAPRELVWKVITECEHLKKWNGPKGYTCPDFSSDFRVGGKYLNSMMDEKGNKIWGTGIYKEIVPLEKLVCSDSFADENGNPVTSDHYDMPGMPLEMTITFLLEEESGKTKLTVMHEGVEPGAAMGWNSCLDKMEELLRELV